MLTFGETMLRLSPPGRQRLEQAPGFDVWVAGSESNTAAALCTLGCSVTWVSRLPDTAVGRKVEAALRGRGMDLSHVIWTLPTERVGIFYAEPAAPPRPATVVYDRARSAASALSPADLPGALFDLHRHLHVTGITPALSASCAETVADAIRRARIRGRTVSLDINYRARLWTPEAARKALMPLMEQVDILFCARGDAEIIFGLTGDGAVRAKALRAMLGIPLVVLTAGADGAFGCDSDEVLAMPAIPVEMVADRFGSGDAFAGAFLSEHLAGASLKQALSLGVAAAALKRTIPGDMLLATRAELEAVLATEPGNGWR